MRYLNNLCPAVNENISGKSGLCFCSGMVRVSGGYSGSKTEWENQTGRGALTFFSATRDVFRIQSRPAFLKFCKKVGLASLPVT